MSKENFSLEEIKQECNELENKILDYYLQRKKQKDICEELNISRGKIDSLVKKYKLTRFRDRANYTIDLEKISIDIPNYWYFLGLFAADGNLHTTNKVDIIQFNLKDFDALKAIKEIIGYTGEIKTYIKQGSEIYFLGITNKDLINSVNTVFKTDCHKKTKKLIFPDIPNKECLCMFLRGFFDGDGSFRAIKNSKFFRFGIYCDSVNFILELEKVLKQITTENVSLYNNTSIEIASKKGNYDLFKFLYEFYESPFCIERKKKRAMQHIIAYEIES